VVEPRRRKPGHRPGLPHWAGETRSSRPPYLPQHRGRKNSETPGKEESVGARSGEYGKFFAEVFE